MNIKLAKTALIFFGPTLLLQPLHVKGGEIPGLLICRTSGRAQCSKEGWCMGTGIEDQGIELKIELENKSISINNIQGVIEQDEEAIKSHYYNVMWRLNLVSYNRFSILINKIYRVYLTNAVNNQITFDCKEK